MKVFVRTGAAVVVVAATATAGLLAFPACSLFVPTNEVQCATSDDCHARGPAFASAVCVANVCQAAGDGGIAGDGAPDPWACLDQPSAPGADPSSQVNVRVLLYDVFSPFTFAGALDGGTDLTLLEYTPQVGVSASACVTLDSDCTHPVAGPTLSDDAGIASLDVPGGFVGFYSLQRSDSVPAYFYPGTRLLAGAPTVSFPTSVTASANYLSLQAALGIPANSDTDAGPGLLSITQFDCNDRHAGGVTFASNPPGAETLYLENTFPSSTAKSTDIEGAAIMVNVPAGSATVTSTLVGQNNRVLMTQNVQVRSGSITLVELRPRTH
jgi:hypothetical protein